VLDGDAAGALAAYERLERPDPTRDPDMAAWEAIILSAAGDTASAAAVVAALDRVAPQIVRLLRGYRHSGLLSETQLPDHVFPDGAAPGGPRDP
jgi:hypothetical protein